MALSLQIVKSALRKRRELSLDFFKGLSFIITILSKKFLGMAFSEMAPV